MKNSNHTIGNRTRDLLASSTVPQPSAPTPGVTKIKYYSEVVGGPKTNGKQKQHLAGKEQFFHLW